MKRDIFPVLAGFHRAGYWNLFCLVERAGLLPSRGTANFVNRRVQKTFASKLFYAERTQGRFQFVTPMPDANAMRIWQKNDA